MKAGDRLRLSVRHMKGRMVESILVILATAVGVSLVAAMAAFIRSYNTQTEYLLSHPAYREVLVEAVGNETELDEPAVEYDPETSSEVSLGFDDIQVALDNTSLVAYGYVSEQDELSTRLSPGIGGGARRLAGGGPGGGAFVEVIEGGAGELPAPGEDLRVSRPDESDAEGGGDRPFAAARMGGRSGAEGAAPAEFDLDQFFEAEDDVLTELPQDSFPARRVSTQYFSAYGLAVAEGSGITDEDLESGNQVIVLGSDLARVLFPDGDAVGTKVRLNLQTFAVTGILAPTSLTDAGTAISYNDLAYVPNAAAQISFGGNVVRIQRPTRTIRFAVEDSANLDGAASELETHFDAEFGEGAVHITTPMEELRVEREKLGRILSVVLFLAAAGLFIASINLFNLMLMRVVRRTRGIGINRALGATRNEITRQFLSESGLMSLAGTAVGLAVSPLVYSLLRSALVADVAETGLVSWPFLVVGAAGAFLFSLIFGVYPARQAGRIDAALAIRAE